MVADKGYHSREQLKALEGGVWKTRIAEPEPSKGYLCWHGDEAARKAVYANRVRLKSDIGRETMRRRGEKMVESPSPMSSIAAACVEHGCADRENLHKRYLIHVAGFNLGVLMRALYGQGTPREAAEAVSASFSFSNPTRAGFRPDPHRQRGTRRNRHPRHRPDAKLKNRDFINGLLGAPAAKIRRISPRWRNGRSSR